MKAVRNRPMCIQQAMVSAMRNRFAQRTVSTLLTLLVVVPLCLTQDAKSQSPSATNSTLRKFDRSKIIFVSDFDLDVANFQQDKGGITGKGYLLPPPPKSLLRRKQQDPATAANNLVELMSVSLVRELEKAGFVAMRLLPTDPRPTDGLVVTGEFTELGEGNQMRRALIGFGSGKAKMELNVAVRDASAEQGLYESSSQTTKGKTPGSMLAMTPYAGAASFVVKFGMTKNAPEKMVKQTASKIAAELTKQLNAVPLIAAQQESNTQ